MNNSKVLDLLKNFPNRNVLKLTRHSSGIPDYFCFDNNKWEAIIISKSKVEIRLLEGEIDIEDINFLCNFVLGELQEIKQVEYSLGTIDTKRVTVQEVKK